MQGVLYTQLQAECMLGAQLRCRQLSVSKGFLRSSLEDRLPANVCHMRGFPLHMRGNSGVVLCAAGLTSYGSQICMTNALRFARAAPALAMSYVSVIITVVYGYFFFHEVSSIEIMSTPTKTISLCSSFIICVTIRECCLWLRKTAYLRFSRALEVYDRQGLIRLPSRPRDIRLSAVSMTTLKASACRSGVCHVMVALHKPCYCYVP